LGANSERAAVGPFALRRGRLARAPSRVRPGCGPGKIRRAAWARAWL